MNRQLYADGTGIAQLLEMQQGAAQDQLTEEQAFALMPESVKEAFASMVEAGASPEEARRLISQQLAEMSIQQMEMQRESQNIPEYYDRRLQLLSPEQMREEQSAISQDIPEYYDSRLQILEPEQMREEMINPSMPGYAYGGLIGRQQYGLGSLVKSVTKGVKGAVKGTVGAVKDIASSDLGKAALTAAAIYYGGPMLSSSLGGPSTWGGIGSALKGSLMGTSLAGSGAASQGLLGKLGLTAGYGGGLSSGILGSLGGKIGAGTLLAGGLGLAAGSMLTPQQIETGMKRDPAAVRAYLAQYYKNLNPEATESEAEQYALQQTREYAAQGGRIGLAMGTMPMGEPRQNPQGIMELDYRQEGGFVPVGIKEKADDVPAMLSKNEFVFTADAVRNAGDGDVEKGAQRLYNTMKTLENGGIA